MSSGVVFVEMSNIWAENPLEQVEWVQRRPPITHDTIHMIETQIHGFSSELERIRPRWGQVDDETRERLKKLTEALSILHSALSQCYGHL